MSRTNAIIEVYQVQGGWQVCVSSYTENNLVKINNLSIPMGDRIILLSGMTLTMGHTTMQFVIK